MTRKEAIERNDFENTLRAEANKPEARRLAELLCRHGRTYARLQEAFCNGPGDWATSKQIEHWEKQVEKREQQLERRIREICSELGEGFEPVFSGDPRGSTVKIRVPSGRTNDWSKEGICVPTA